MLRRFPWTRDSPVRRIVHHPTASIAAALTLALAVGASTAVFSVVHAVLLRPLPLRCA